VARRWVLSDGSEVALAGTAEFAVEQESKAAIITRLGSGRARFDVTPNKKRRFLVHAADVTVAVLGTAFTVERLPNDPERVEVVVERGLVSVSFPGGEKKLAAGTRGVFPPERSEQSPGLAIDELGVDGDEAPSGAERGVTGQRTWRDLAKQGKHGDAYEHLRGEGGPGAVRGPADLMLAADVARLSGHPSEALTPLTQVYTAHSGDARAPLAAFTAGKILMDQLGSPGRAAQAFERARRLSPSGALAQNALEREFSARKAAGQTDRARSLARDYLRQYPKGPHRARAQQLLE
jgi:transmembrane sensor